MVSSKQHYGQCDYGFSSLNPRGVEGLVQAPRRGPTSSIHKQPCPEPLNSYLSLRASRVSSSNGHLGRFESLDSLIPSYPVQALNPVGVEGYQR